MPIRVRREQPGDEKAIFDVTFRAFGQETEPMLVDRLRINCPEGLSLVAEDDENIIGHILFTPARIENGTDSTSGMGLAPLAVLPSRQRQGVGSALVRAGLAQLRTAGVLFVVVLGHPGYYPRFGFEKASQSEIRCEYDQVPDEAFMVLTLKARGLDGVHGKAIMRPEFAAAI
jgi:putative acetyltransferase